MENDIQDEDVVIGGGKNKTYLIIVILTALLFLSVAYSLSLSGKFEKLEKKYDESKLDIVDEQEISEDVIVSQNEESGNTNSFSDNGAVRYFTQEIDCWTSAPGAECDLRLIRINQEGQSEIVDPNITSNFQNQMNRKESVSIQEFLNPQDGKQIVFHTIFGSSACCSLYSYDIPTGKFSQVPNGNLSNYWGGISSPDNRMLLGMDKDKKGLYLVKVLTGEKKTVVTVGGDETLVAGIEAYGGEEFGNYSWINNSWIQYEVYDPSIEIGIFGENRKPIEIRKLDVTNTFIES